MVPPPAPPTVASALTRKLGEEIEAGGPISFARFMEVALYDREHGYYEQGLSGPGRRGDYFTSVSVGAIFGELLGARLARWLATFAEEGTVQVVEAGAHEGALAADLLLFWRRYHPALTDRLEYWLLEPSPRRQHWQRTRLAAFSPQVRWAGDWQDLPPVRGVILSNELLDALPVRRWQWGGFADGWREMGVTWDGNHFAWQLLPEHRAARRPALPPALLTALPTGYILETGEAGLDWWRQAAQRLACGWLMTLDYGDGPPTGSLRPERVAGTLRGYRGHRVSADVLADPGEQDLTAHVDFVALQTAGEAAGLQTLGLKRQEAFLAGILIELEAEAGGAGGPRFPAWTPERRRQCLTLIHPGQLGATHQVLVQQRERG